MGNCMNIDTRSRLLASTLLFGSLALVQPVLAQTVPVENVRQDATPEDGKMDEANGGQDIIVTGSRISNPNLVLSSPVSAVTSEEINLRQPQSAEEFLRQLPGTAPGIGTQVNNGANGSATTNLRNLGTNRNLVLINGRRVVPASLQLIVDTNVIPVALIDRVDVFTGGASSVYGADAVAGVVNFVTKRNFSGVNLSGNYGITERGDGRNYRTDLLVGANLDGGRGNVVLGLGYLKSSAVLQGERDLGRVSLSSNTGLPQGSSAANPASILFPFPAARFDPATGTIVNGLSDFNFQPLNVYQTPAERYNVFGSARYEVSPAIEIFTEGFFTKSRITQNIAPGGSFFNQFRVPLNNQFLTPTQRTQLCTQAVGISGGLPAGTDCASAIAAGTEINAIVARRFTEAGPRVTEFTTNTFQITAGARGALTSSLNWEISGQYGESSRTNTSTRQGLAERLQQGLRACPAGSAQGCVPINIFGGPGSFTPAMFSFLDVATNTFTDTELGDVQGSISGDLGFASPLAEQPIGIAIGAEYRRYAGSQRGDLPSSTPGAVLGAGGAFVSASGEYNSKEVYGELNAPLVENLPGVHLLSVEAGVRYSDYSTTGGNWTYKAGGSYAPIRDVRFRGLYSRAVRAPNLFELFAPQNTILNNRAVDPCQGTRAQVAARGANFISLCEAQVVAAGLPTSVVGTIAPPAAGQINITTVGNTALAPEIATTITGGVVLEPSFLPGFSATADWYRIRVRDAISSPTQSDIIDGCFAQASATSPFCQNIFRNPLTGGLSGDASTTRGPILRQTNQGRIEVSGVDFGFAYRRKLGLVNTTVAFNGNYTDRNRFQATPTSINRECVRYYSVSCESIQPRWSWNSRITGGYEGQSLSLLWRYIGRTRVEPVALPAGQRPPVDQPQNAGPANILPAFQSVKPHHYFDLAYRGDITEVLTFTFLVENLFDRDPPNVGNTIGATAFNSGNTYPSTYDALGRRFRVGVNLAF